MKPSAELPPVQDYIKDHKEAQTLPTEMLSENKLSVETPTEKTSVDTPFSIVPPSTVNPSAGKDGTQRNCNFNNSQVNDDQSSIDTTLKNMTNVNSGAHTDSNVNGNGTVTDDMLPKSQEQNAKRDSSKTQVESSSTTETSVAGNSNRNTEMPCEPDVPDGAHAVDGSAPSNPPVSQPKSHRLLRGRKKSNKEGKLRICVYVCVCLLSEIKSTSVLIYGFMSAKPKAFFFVYFFLHIGETNIFCLLFY